MKIIKSVLRLLAFISFMYIYYLYVKWSWGHIIDVYKSIKENLIQNANSGTIIYLFINEFFLIISFLSSLFSPILLVLKIYRIYIDNKEDKNEKEMLLEENSKRKELELYNNSIMNITERKPHNYYKRV